MLKVPAVRSRSHANPQITKFQSSISIFEAEIQPFASGCKGGCYGTKCCILDFFVLQCKCSFTRDIVVIWKSCSKQPFLACWPLCTCGCQGKAASATKLQDLQSAFIDFSYESSIKTLSQLEAEIQSIAGVVTIEPKFVTGCQGKACLATKLW